MITRSETISKLSQYLEGYIATNPGIRLNVLFADWTGSYNSGEIRGALDRLQDAGLIEFKSGRFYYATATAKAA